MGTDDQQQQRLKVLNRQNQVIKDWNYVQDPEENGIFTQTQFIRMNRGRCLQGFMSGTSLGEVKTMLHPYQERGTSRALSHKGAITRLIAT